MTFDLNEKQVEKLNKWKEGKDRKLAKGNFRKPDYEFCFSTSGIGWNVTVKCADGTVLDLTDYDGW